MSCNSCTRFHTWEEAHPEVTGYATEPMAECLDGHDTEAFECEFKLGMGSISNDRETRETV